VQRRHQKLIEEAPSIHLSEEQRRDIGERAVAGALAVGYTGAGTMEFLLDHEGNLSFMEMNARIQVEHPVSEMVTSIDLIQEQIRVAAGEPLSVTQEDIVLRGHAIECRVNAEDPDRDFAPAAGRLDVYVPPGGPWTRVDSHCYPGWNIAPFYDSLIAKLIVWAPTRLEAIERMDRALGVPDRGPRREDHDPLPPPRARRRAVPLRGRHDRLRRALPRRRGGRGQVSDERVGVRRPRS
jgi:acetyl-CoA carboxylase biotin carboxylase subunit